MTYDPNDPKRTDPVDRDPAAPKETYVEPVERRSSALPLIIGVLLALALAYFVLQRFMTDDTVAVGTSLLSASILGRCGKKHFC